MGTAKLLNQLLSVRNQNKLISFLPFCEGVMLLNLVLTNFGKNGVASHCIVFFFLKFIRKSGTIFSHILF